MPEVVRAQTPFTLADAAAAIVDGLVLIGEEATQQQAALLLGQIALETRSGQACQNHNPGNLSANDQTYKGNWYRPPWFDVSPSSPAQMQRLHEQMLAGKAPRAFRAYSSLREGMLAYFRSLQHDFPFLLRASRSGDPHEFGDAIRISHYTPDAPSSTGDSLASLQRDYLSKGWFASLPLSPPDSPAPVSSAS